jgi:Trk K+ transport system NAD-binding subunit
MRTAVIGLGTFGSTLAASLAAGGDLKIIQDFDHGRDSGGPAVTALAAEAGENYIWKRC